jgi:hypothetical protein
LFWYWRSLFVHTYLDLTKQTKKKESIEKKKKSSKLSYEAMVAKYMVLASPKLAEPRSGMAQPRGRHAGRFDVGRKRAVVEA